MRAALLVAAGAMAGTALAQGAPGTADPHNPAEDVELQRVEVIGVTPLPGLGAPLREVPANVQSFGVSDLSSRKAGNLAQFLELNANGVTVNAAQGNPWQPDIAFRGFTASPLLGEPQGVSVFQDGVRINEPFGDVVNWDLLPQSAIAGVQVIPGSNPVFGLNTLGGAIAVYTKSGSTAPGTALELSGGSWGRRTATIEHGGSHGPWDWFGTVNVSRDRGWAQHDPSRVGQWFGKVGYQTDATDLDLSLTGASNRLEGDQTLPRSMLDDFRQAYTFPDLNRNRATMLALKGSHFLAPDLLLGGNAWWRKYHNANVSSDVNDDFGEIDDDTGAPSTSEAINDRSDIDQTSGGGGLQLTWTRPLAGHANRAVVGASGEFGRATFTQAAQPADFGPDRGTVATGDFEPSTDAGTRSTTASLFLLDTFALDRAWSVTASGRYDEARVRIRDRSGDAPDLDGDHAFRRFSPSIGATWSPDATLTAYANWNQGARAPTAVELTCADPEAPCRLPNAFLADPPLREVVARTLEVGARGKAAGWQWSAAAWRTTNDDDIQFISAGNAINAGYFRNVGRTRRQGLELAAGGPVAARLHADLRYTFIDARYLTSFVEHSPDNDSADENGDIVVPGGAHLPGIPRHSLRLRLEATVTPTWQVGGNVLAATSQRARGDENNRDADGRVAGYAIVDLDTNWQVRRGVALFARIDNLFDRRYATFGIKGENVFANAAHTFDPDNARSETFVGQGAPFGAWAGVRLTWD